MTNQTEVAAAKPPRKEIEMATGRTATSYPECEREACFVYHLGHCMALTEADFKLRKCPFLSFGVALQKQRSL